MGNEFRLSFSCNGYTYEASAPTDSKYFDEAVIDMMVRRMKEKLGATGRFDGVLKR